MLVYSSTAHTIRWLVDKSGLKTNATFNFSFYRPFISCFSPLPSFRWFLVVFAVFGFLVDFPFRSPYAAWFEGASLSEKGGVMRMRGTAGIIIERGVGGPGV